MTVTMNLSIKKLLFLVAFLGLSGSIAAFVPRSVVFPDVTESLFSSPRQDRHANVQVMFDMADSYNEDAVGTLGIFQKFNLKHLAKSTDLMSREQGNGAYVPETLQTLPQWVGQNIWYQTVSSIRAQRVLFSYADYISLGRYAEYVPDEHVIKHRLVEGGSLCFGLSLPLVQAQSTNFYELVRYNSYLDIQRNLPEIDAQAERLRSELFKKIGLQSNVWDHAGLGDLDVYAGFSSHADYFLRLRTLDIGVLFGCLFPTGMQRDQNYPSSLPFSLSAPSFTLSSYADLGLKDYLNIGLTAGIVATRSKTHQMRISVYEEPSAYSPLLTEIAMNPGITSWLNPHLQIKNVANNLHFTANYACVWHARDAFKDERLAPQVKTLYDRGDDLDLGTNVVDRGNSIKRLEEGSYWSSRHVGISLTYEPWQAHKDAVMNPLFTVGCQFAHRGKNIPQMYHAYVSATCQF